MLKHTTRIQITVGSVFISRFTMNNIAPNLQKCWIQKIAFKIISRMHKQPNSFNTSIGSTSKVLPFYDFRLSFMIRSVSPTRSSTPYAHERDYEMRTKTRRRHTIELI